MEDISTPKSVHESEGIKELPEPAQQYLAMKGAGIAGPATLDAMLPGTEWKGVREDLQKHGFATYESSPGEERMLAADFDGNGHLLALAAAVPRNPGTSFSFLNEIQDFQDIITGTKQGRKDAIALFHKIARAEGMVANAINKMASLVAVEGKFKVRGVKGKRGVAGNKVAEELQGALNWWKENVNTRPADGVITGDRGIKAFVLQGSRLLFIEGDHIGRHVTAKSAVQIPNLKPFSLPMNLQTFSAQHIEAAEGLEGTNIELLYWVPPNSLIQTLQSPKDPNVAKVLKQILGSKVVAALIKDKKYLLDPALMFHIKHRGLGIESFGQSLIEPTLSDIRYKRMLDALEVVTISNLINRLVIVKVGDPNVESDYHKQEVTAGRLHLLQRIMRNVGPSATILWGGHDIDVVEVSAHESILALDDRFKVAERRILMALGVPAVLLVGEGGDGKAVANTAALTLAASLKEVQEQYAQMLRTLAERISLDNGYEEVDVVWEWSDDLLDNKEAAAEMILKLFQVGLLDTRTSLEGLGFDADAVTTRQNEDVSKGFKEKAYGPPLAAVTTNPAGDGGAAGGRPKKEANPARDPREGKETGDTEPNK